jgi:hypothetical protein
VHAARLTPFAALSLAGIAWLATPVSAAWQPANVLPSSATLAEVLRRVAEASGAPSPAYERRRERWTYRNGTVRLPVEVFVRDRDYRAVVTMGSAYYSAGRRRGVPWRADASGIAHATFGDLQGDAIDRLPHVLLPLAAPDCSIAGEVAQPAAGWVVVCRPPRDAAHWFFIDQTSGRTTHEQTREGKRVVSIAYDRFERVDGAVRPMHWEVHDGDRANDLDVTVDAVEPGTVSDDDVAPPPPTELFAMPRGVDTVPLPAHFAANRIDVDAGVDGRGVRLILDTGTQSVMLNRGLLGGRRGTTLEHGTVASIRVGTLIAKDVSVLSVPLYFDGILGFDFFVGHVVHIDYRHRHVEVLSRNAAEPVFDDPSNIVMRADFSEGLPLVRGRVDEADGDRFALDTGSAHLYLFKPFLRRFDEAPLRRWKTAAFPWTHGEYETPSYLEGSVRVSAHSIPVLDLGAVRFTDVIAGIEEPNPQADAIELPFDAVVGTDALGFFEIWFDPDGGRVAFRR